MRNLFPGYYKPTEDEFQELWQEGIFCFDTNILLNVYRYSSKTRERLFEILNKLKERIWIPYQVAHEYQKQRLNVISQQLEPYKEISNKLDNNFAELKKQLNLYSKRHSFSDFIEIEQIIKTIDIAYTEVKNILKDAESKYPDLVNNDEYRETLTELFDESRIGKPSNEQKLSKLHKQAESRYAKKQPPGYKDAKKDNQEKYGDVLIWFELIDHAKSVKKPLIFITDDNKEDWWLEYQGKTISPRPDINDEIVQMQKENSRELLENFKNRDLIDKNIQYLNGISNEYMKKEIERLLLSKQISSPIDSLIENLYNSFLPISKNIKGLDFNLKEIPKIPDINHERE